jgi:hypothetical protein
LKLIIFEGFFYSATLHESIPAASGDIISTNPRPIL